MADDVKNSVLLKKLGAKSPAPEMVTITPATALRKAAIRAAQNMGGLILAVPTLQEVRSSVSGIVDELPENAMLMLMAGPDASFGLAVADCQLIAAIIEHQTTGRVLPSAADPRPPTKTDTVIVSDLVDQILTLFETNLAPLNYPPPVGGFRFAMPLENPRAVTMALEEMPYRAYDMTLDLANGAKTGQLRLVFPWFTASAEQLDAKKNRDWAKSLHEATATSPVPLRAVLHRKSMSYQSIANLKVDDMIEVPNQCLQAISIEGDDGVQVAQAKLGQVAGVFAVKIVVAGKSSKGVSDDRFDPGLAGSNLGGVGDVVKPAPNVAEPESQSEAPEPQEVGG